MDAAQLINSSIPALRPTDRLRKVLKIMQQHDIGQLPVCADGQYQGLITSQTLIESPALDLQQKIEEFKLVASQCHAAPQEHFYELLKLASAHRTQTIAVLKNNPEQYLGVVLLQDLLSTFSKSAALETPGSILVIALGQKDYSLAEISRILEGEKAQILLSCLTSDPEDPYTLQLTLKINQTQPETILATLERFQYRVVGLYSREESYIHERTRLDLLFKYLSL